MGRVKRITVKGKASRVKDLEAAEYVNAIIMDSEMPFSLSFSLSLSSFLVIAVAAILSDL